MDIRTHARFSELIDAIGAQLDIPDHIYEDAEIKYLDIADHLSATDSEILDYNPELYPQGSFRLGTVVMPLGRDGEYDIDLVCKLDIEKERTTQKDLKKIVGDRLKSRPDIRQMLSESRRCWKIEYPENDSASFHMDVLPSIPNRENRPDGILLTDKDLRAWQHSNPKLYSLWFYSRMQIELSRRKKLILDEAVASIEDVPDWKVKTPLQRAVQILKRHRDVYFNLKENKPVSIIITTLAAHAYQGEEDYLDAVVNIVGRMEKFIVYKDGRWEILNPVEPNENFAEKWNEYPERQIAFSKWLAHAKKAFSELQNSTRYDSSLSILNESIGNVVVAKSEDLIKRKQIPNALVPAKSDTSHAKPLEWPVASVGGVKVKISYLAHKHKTRESRMWLVGKDSVPRGIWLRFVVRVDGVAEPYDIKWQVINTGRDARMHGQMRGEIEIGNGSSKYEKWEQTAYVGTHEVRAFVIKNNVCIAKSSIDVLIR